MPVVKLTALNVGTLPAAGGKRTDYTDALLPGFVLRVSPSGTRTWVVRYRAGGRGSPVPRITLGHYPHMSLAQARARARPMLEAVDRGDAPQAGAQAGTVADLVRSMIDGLVRAERLRPTTEREWRRFLRAEIGRAPFASSAAAALRRGEVRAWLGTIAQRSGYMANRSLEVLRRAYSWGIEQDLLESSPCERIPRPGVERQSERVLSIPELCAIWRALDQLDERRRLNARGRRPGPYPDATRLLLLTGVRRAMVLGMRREELEDLDGPEPRWMIPGGFEGRTKSRRAHVVPLSPDAVAIIRRRLAEVAGSHLFPGEGGRGEAVPACWSPRWTATLRDHAQDIYAPRPWLRSARMERWTIHDFRRALATHLREHLHVSRDIVALLLGHAQGGAAVTGRYDLAEMLPERRAAMVAWAAWLRRIASDQPAGADVLPMAR